MIKVLVHGSNGKMGGHVLEAISKNESCELFCGVDKMSSGNENYPYYSDFDSIKDKPDVIIDFGKAAKACGIGERGLSGKILSPIYGPYIRYCFIMS